MNDRIEHSALTEKVPTQTLNVLTSKITACHSCLRLRRHSIQIAEIKRKSYRDQEYWGKPVSGFGDPSAKLLVIGLAPGAHGANRTGRVFTGDRSGDWLYQALHKYGFASQPESSFREDGMKLRDAYITCIVKCAPPNNRPLPEEFQKCSRFFQEELEYFPSAQVYIALGQMAFQYLWRNIKPLGLPSPQPQFKHGLEIEIRNRQDVFKRSSRKPVQNPSQDPFMKRILLSYHPSQQNTFTGKLTRPMFHSIFSRARQLIDHASYPVLS